MQPRDFFHRHQEDSTLYGQLGFFVFMWNSRKTHEKVFNRWSWIANLLNSFAVSVRRQASSPPPLVIHASINCVMHIKRRNAMNLCLFLPPIHRRRQEQQWKNRLRKGGKNPCTLALTKPWPVQEAFDSLVVIGQKVLLAYQKQEINMFSFA